MSSQGLMRKGGRFYRRPIAVFAALLLAGCSSFGNSGPSTRAINAAASKPNPAIAAQIKLVDLDDTAARRVIAAGRSSSLAEELGDGQVFNATVARGDVLNIAIWEAPPAALFGATMGSQSLVLSETSSTDLPEQMVDVNGRIVVPFAGSIVAAGKSPNQIEREIVSRLAGLAHKPQAIVRIVRNAASNVSVVGDVVTSGRVTLTPKGERLLDVLASSGGVRQAVGKVSIQVARAGRVASLPLEQIIKDPAQNIRLQADDVVTALYQPYSFTALGAVNNNAEISFEGSGLTLAQALGRIGGLRDDRADVRGVFIFRLEDPAALDPALVAGAKTTPDGRIPVIYRVDLKNPSSFFVAQGFPLRDKDVVYVSSAPITDFQKFLNIVSSTAFSIVGVANLVP